MVRRGLVIASFAMLAMCLAGACDDGPVPQPCSDIPAGGCPIARGVSCQDPSCEAVYACRAENRWELVEHCPPRENTEAGAPRDAAIDGGDEPALDASIDAPPGAFGGPGCASLQSPDCSLGVAMACPADCCGCEDLYVCEEGGWTLWGYCGDGGIARGR